MEVINVNSIITLKAKRLNLEVHKHITNPINKILISMTDKDIRSEDKVSVKTNINYLPIEILLHIFSYLGKNNNSHLFFGDHYLIFCKQVCFLWKQIIDRYFTISPEPIELIIKDDCDNLLSLILDSYQNLKQSSKRKLFDRIAIYVRYYNAQLCRQIMNRYSINRKWSSNRKASYRNAIHNSMYRAVDILCGGTTHSQYSIFRTAVINGNYHLVKENSGTGVSSYLNEKITYYAFAAGHFEIVKLYVNVTGNHPRYNKMIPFSPSISWPAMINWLHENHWLSSFVIYQIIAMRNRKLCVQLIDLGIDKELLFEAIVSCGDLDTLQWYCKTYDVMSLLHSHHFTNYHINPNRLITFTFDDHIIPILKWIVMKYPPSTCHNYLIESAINGRYNQSESLIWLLDNANDLGISNAKLIQLVKRNSYLSGLYTHLKSFYLKFTYWTNMNLDAARYRMANKVSTYTELKFDNRLNIEWNTIEESSQLTHYLHIWKNPLSLIKNPYLYYVAHPWNIYEKFRSNSTTDHPFVKTFRDGGKVYYFGEYPAIENTLYVAKNDLMDWERKNRITCLFLSLLSFFHYCILIFVYSFLKN